MLKILHKTQKGLDSCACLNPLASKTDWSFYVYKNYSRNPVDFKGKYKKMKGLGSRNNLRLS